MRLFVSPKTASLENQRQITGKGFLTENGLSGYQCSHSAPSMHLPIESQSWNSDSRGQCKMMQNVPTCFRRPIQNPWLKVDDIFLSLQGAILIFMGFIVPTMKASVIEVLLGEY